MTDLAKRIREKIADAEDWDGKLMTQWDAIRALLARGNTSDLPRLMFEAEIGSFTELLEEAAKELEGRSR